MIVILGSCSSVSRYSNPKIMGYSKITTQIMAGFAASMSVACSGFHTGWTSPSLPQLLADDSDVPITSDESSWIVSFFMFGNAFGTLFGAVLVNRWGRKWTLLLTTIPYLSSAIFLAVAQGFWMFLVARFIAGVGCGITYTVIPMYLGEIAEDRIRGALVAMINFMMNSGILLTYCIGPWISRVALACFGGALPILFGLTFFWMPESPYFLILKKRTIEAENSLVQFRGTSNVTAELYRIQEYVGNDQRNAGTIRKLVMARGNRKALSIVLGLMVAQQFTGITAILSYGSMIFEASGSTLSASVSVIIIGVIQILSGVVTIFTVDSAGRKPLLMLSVCGSIIFLSGEALFFQLQASGTDVSSITWLPLTSVVGFVLLYALGLGCLPHVILSELFPCSIKALATMIFALGFALSGTIVLKLYQVVADGFGINVTFWGFSVITVFSGIFIHFVLPETKQKSLRDIQDELHGTTHSEMM